MCKKQNYDSPLIQRSQVEMEDSFCAASLTGKNVVDENNNKVGISGQGHGEWNGIGDDINAGWE